MRSAVPTTGTATVLRANALDLPLANESVDVICTSPPYFSLRSYTDGGEHYEGQIGSEDTPQQFLQALWAVMAECWRVLKPTGSCFVNLGDKYAGAGGHNNSGISGKSTLQGNGHVGGGPKIRATRRSAPDAYNKNSGGVRTKSLIGLPWRFAIGCVDGMAASNGQRWILRAEMVWEKPNGLPESVGDRVRRNHEQFFHFTKEPVYFSAIDEIRQPYDGDRSLSRRMKRPGIGKHDQRAVWTEENPLGALPGSVWKVPTEPLNVPQELGVDHFAVFPSEWPRRLILGWAPNGVCVECGDGRRPQIDEEYHKLWNHEPKRSAANPDNNLESFSANGRGYVVRRIMGYECSCDEPTAATRPAIVVDPFGGTGTVAMVAKALGHHGISTDLSADYCRLAEWRTNDPQEIRDVQAKTYGIKRDIPKIAPGQFTLFGKEVI